MSSACIEVLSSDDEVEVIGSFSRDTSKPSSNVSMQPKKDAIQRLSRNSNIDVTITLGSQSEESVKQNHIKKQQPSLPDPLGWIGDLPSEIKKEKKKSLASEVDSVNDVIIILDDDTPNNPIESNKIGHISLKNFFNSQINDDLPSKNGSLQSPEPSTSADRTKKKNHIKSPNGVKTSSCVKLPNVDRQISVILTVPKPEIIVNNEESDPLQLDVKSNAEQLDPLRLDVKQFFKKLDPVQLDVKKKSQQSEPLQKNLPTKNVRKSVPEDEDVVIIDVSDEETEDKNNFNTSSKTSRTKGKPQSITEKIVTELRERINITYKNRTSTSHSIQKKSPKKSISEPSDDRGVSRKSSVKTIVPTPVSPGPSDFKNHFRVTRSSTSTSSSSGASQSTSKAINEKQNTPSALDIRNQPINKYSIENMFSGMVDICNRVFTDDKLESKLWSTFRQASESVLKSEEFINALKTALSSSENSEFELLDEKLIVKRNVKEVIRIMKRHPVAVDSKVKKLTKMLNLIRGRIKKLEETEVTSDEDGEENPYVLLDRYRARAAKIYEKICELQSEPSHAGRLVRQRFTFAGNSGYPKIEQALYKFYLKTKSFPDFMDVKTLVESTIKKENLEIQPHMIQNIAQSVFIEFGNRLQRMRCFDEYSIMNEYLEDGLTKDPALDNEALFKALSSYDSSKKIREAEHKIFEEFSIKQIEHKNKDSNPSMESEAGSDGSDDEDAAENRSDKQEDLHFSDTDEELINSEVRPKRSRSSSVEEDEESPKKTLRVEKDTKKTSSKFKKKC